MNFYINKNNHYNIDCCFSMNQYKYKKFTNKINEFKKDFEIFLDNDKKKVVKPKKKFYILNINKLFRKLVFDSTNKVLKNYEKNSQKTSKRFFSAKEIEKYKNKKILFLKLIRAKNSKNNISTIDKNSRNYFSIRNNSAKTLNIKNYNKRNRNKSNFSNKSIYSQSSFLNSLYDQSYRKSAKLNFKEKFYSNLINNKSTIDVHKSNNYLKAYDSIKKNDSEIIIKDYNDIRNNNKYDNNNCFNNDYSKEDFKSFKQKLNLNKLKLKVNKYENSTKYLPNNEIIFKNMKERNKFVNKKYLKNDKLDYSIVNNNELNNSIRSYINKRNIHSAPKKFGTLDKIQMNSLKDNSNSNRTLNIMNKYNTSILMKKINDIQRKIKIKKRILKKEKKIKNNYVKKIMNYFKNKKISSKDIDNDMKKDFIEYQNKIGHFIKIDDNYLYTSHISLIIDNRSTLLNKYNMKKIW